MGPAGPWPPGLPACLPPLALLRCPHPLPCTAPAAGQYRTLPARALLHFLPLCFLFMQLIPKPMWSRKG